MSKMPISQQVQQFLAAHVGSVEQLEVLLLLYRTAPSSWTAPAVAKELASNRPSIESRLLDWHARGLLDYREDDGELHFSFKPSPRHDAVVRDLAAAYAERRTSVITLIFNRPPNPAKSFSDAFTIRKPEQ